MKNLIRTIKNYLDIEYKIDFAYMIDGEWGSGKTYFVRNELDNYLRNYIRKEKDKSIRFTLLYTSVQGVKSFGEVVKNIIYDLKLKTKSGNCNYSFIEKIDIRDYEKEPIRIGSLLKSLLEQNRTLKEEEIYVIVIDDLERYAILPEINLLIGNIHKYVTEIGLRTIFICDETKLSNSILYKEIKEKVVRHTINFTPNQKEQLGSVMNMNTRYMCMKEHKDYILDIILKLKIKNWRTVQIILDQMLEIKKCNKKFFDKEYFEFIFKNISILILEKKSSCNVLIDNYDSLKIIESQINKIVNKINDEGKTRKLTGDSENNTNAILNSKEIFLLNFYEKYIVNQGLNFKYIDQLFKYIVLGTSIKSNLLKEELDTSLDYNSTLYVRSLDVLERFYSMEEEELQDLFDRIIKFLIEGRYKAEDISRAFRIFQRIKASDYLGELDMNYLDLYIKSYIESYKNSMIELERFTSGLTEFILENPEMSEDIQNEYIELVTKEKYKIDDIYIKEMFKYIDQYIAIYDLKGVNNKYFDDTSLFQKMIRSENLSYFDNISNQGITFFERYLESVAGQISGKRQDVNEQVIAIRTVINYIEKLLENGEKGHMKNIRYNELLVTLKDRI
ncbi:P-loop NTPase fold protein [Spirochaeta cellobiosiphila]|uniref:P-loop NTPase fold protein n=1 Tax=Spirochaeta cellobiosiphila TaxID=504483 RepID=UPI0004028D06|nr:P-loop NTPase fold protein [Spirochaeta cellobiosiphila]